MPEDKSEILNKEYSIVIFMGMPMVGSLLIYWALIQFVIQAPQSQPLVATTLRQVVYFMALASLALIVLLKKILLQKNPQDNLPTLIAKLKTSSLITFALCEAPAVYGLVLYFMGGGSRKDFYIMVAYSLSLFSVFFPRMSQWRQYTDDAAN